MRALRACAAGLLAGSCATAGAQAARALSIEPSFNTTVSIVDSTRRGVSQDGDVVTQLQPGLRITSKGGRVRGSLAYTLNAVNHSRSDLPAELQNNLYANFSAEVVERTVFVDASASVGQGVLSAYGQQSADPTQINTNRLEVATVSISPYARTSLAGLATVDLRLRASATNARKSKAADSTTTGAALSLSSPGSRALFGWGATVQSDRVDYRVGRATQTDSYSVSVTAVPDPELSLSLRAGQESTDVTALERRSYSNVGGTLRWTPNPRTLASIDIGDRYFGRSQRVLLEYRLSQSSLRFNSIRDATTGADPRGVGAQVSLYQLYDSQLSSAYPDPTLRDQAVRVQLRAEGQDPNTVIGGGFINRGVSLQRRDDIGWTYSGRRLSVNVLAFLSESELLDPTVAAAADAMVKQRGWSATVSYQLTPTVSTNLTGSMLSTLATATRPGTELKSLALTGTSRLGRYIDLVLSGRYSVFNSPTDGYREGAVTGSFSVRF